MKIVVLTGERERTVDEQLSEKPEKLLAESRRTIVRFRILFLAFVIYKDTRRKSLFNCLLPRQITADHRKGLVKIEKSK